MSARWSIGCRAVMCERMRALGGVGPDAMGAGAFVVGNAVPIAPHPWSGDFQRALRELWASWGGKGRGLRLPPLNVDSLYFFL